MLYFETDVSDGFREPGFSKERRMQSQINFGPLTDENGNPLALNSFEGNKAEKATMVPTIQAFKKAHNLRDVAIVADAGMISAAIMQEIGGGILLFILGMKNSGPRLTRFVSGRRATRKGFRVRSDLRAVLARRSQRQAPRPDDLPLVPGRLRPLESARDRRTGRQGQSTVEGKDRSRRTGS
ncbi:hypothetical protein [Kineosporia babensis]|uniref:Transposase IS4-like domain-containing protein n=1 Tax=Kineosporia babensis TaxID=499548 RepID=A0A9X1NGU5_9ACTN|nr:hypothetical protein [Kineosporia babensis]MCD5313898.1 hypothetical protein [Kineosporia babensis]